MWAKVCTSHPIDFEGQIGKKDLKKMWRVEKNSIVRPAGRDQHKTQDRKGNEQL